MRGGVEHERKRDRPIALDELGNPARKPIVRVDNVVSDAVAEREKRHFGCKIGKILKKLVLADFFGGTGVYRDDADAVTGVLDFWSVGIGAAGKDIDGESKIRNVAAELSYINVHPAGIFAAQVGEG
jgi:hypothetical protein